MYSSNSVTAKSFNFGHFLWPKIYIKKGENALASLKKESLVIYIKGEIYIIRIYIIQRRLYFYNSQKNLKSLV